MKYLIFVLSCLIIFSLSSCKGDETVDPSVTPDCVQRIIRDFQENDANPSCITAVRRYTFEGATVFEVQEDDCFNGLVTIIDMDCNTICVLVSTNFNIINECGNSDNFYDDAVLIEEIWEEEN